MNGIEAIQTDIKYIVKEQTECKEHQKEENDRIQDQVNEQKAKLETTKKGIYDKIESVNSNLEGKIDTVSTDVQVTKWTIVKVLFIAMGLSAFLQGLINKIFSLGG